MTRKQRLAMIYVLIAALVAVAVLTRSAEIVGPLAAVIGPVLVWLITGQPGQASG